MSSHGERPSFIPETTERAVQQVIAWTGAHGLKVTQEQIQALSRDLAEGLRMFSPTGDATADALLVFTTALESVDRVVGKTGATDPRLWRLTLSVIGGDTAAELFRRGGYPCPPDDTMAEIGKAIVKRAVGLVEQAHRFDPETAVQKMRDHTAIVVELCLGSPPSPQMLN